MRILFFQWNSCLNPGIEAALQKLKIEYEIFHYNFKDWEKDEHFLEQFDLKLCNSEVELVL